MPAISRGSRRVTLLALAGIAAGLAAAVLGYPRLAAVLWAATSTLGFVPLAVAVFRHLRMGKAGVDIIALVAIAGALVLQEFLAGAVIALMYSGGRALEEFAESRAREELEALLSRVPRIVNRYEGETIVSVPVADIRAGDRLLVKPGEVLPVDGTVESAAILDESALTGESLPVRHDLGDTVRSGALNAASAPFNLRAEATADESTYAAVVRLVAQAQASKAPLARLADRYAVIFLPFTGTVAAAAWIVSGDPVRALAVLVVATPCPLILAAPIAIVAGISRAARMGIVVKCGSALETLAQASVLVIDKTGTVTTGAPRIANIESAGRFSPDDILRFAAALDQFSPHVLARPILDLAARRELQLAPPADVTEKLGSGIRGKIDGREVALGKSDWVISGTEIPGWVRTIRRRAVLEGTSAIFVAVDGEPAGALIVEDPVRPDAASTLRLLRRQGFQRIVMLSGDHAEPVTAAGAAVGIDSVLAERSPAAKVDAVRAARREGVVAMVGDGINDAPALAAAHVGIALGAHGSTAASEAADIVLLADRLDHLADAARIAKRSRGIAIQSITVGMAPSIAGMGLAAAGMLTPVAGAVAQEGIDVLVILNALRALGGSRRPRTSGAEQPAVCERIREEHDRLLPGVKHVRMLADHMDSMSPRKLRRELEIVHQFLVEELLPHQEAEDALVYPAVAKAMGGDDPTGTMRRAHMEIARFVSALGRAIDDLPSHGPGREELQELRRILYGLDAIVRLHFAQENESYLPLVETPNDAEMRKTA